MEHYLLRQKLKRSQPFTLLLRSLHAKPIILGISPVGVLRPDADPRPISAYSRQIRARITAIPNSKGHSYDISVEDAVFLSDEKHDIERIQNLLRRITTSADALELKLLERDEPLSKFRSDLEKE